MLKTKKEFSPDTTIPEAYTRSHYNKGVPKPLMPLLNMLTNSNFEPIFRWSRNHVPHIVFQYKKQGFSVCFFGSDKTYKVFHPYPNTSETIRHTCFTPEEVLKYVKNGKC